MSVRLVVLLLLLCLMGRSPLTTRPSPSCCRVSRVVRSGCLSLVKGSIGLSTIGAQSARISTRSSFRSWVICRFKKIWPLLQISDLCAKTVSDCCRLTVVYTSCAPMVTALKFTVRNRCRSFAAARSHKILRGKYFVAPNQAEQFRNPFFCELRRWDGVIGIAGKSYTCNCRTLCLASASK